MRKISWLENSFPIITLIADGLFPVIIDLPQLIFSLAISVSEYC